MLGESEKDPHHFPGRILLNAPLNEVVSQRLVLNLLKDLVQGVRVYIDCHAGVGELSQFQKLCRRHARDSLRLIRPKARLPHDARHAFLEAGCDVHEDGLRQATVYQSIRFDGFSKHVGIPPVTLVLINVQ